MRNLGWNPAPNAAYYAEYSLLGWNLAPNAAYYAEYSLLGWNLASNVVLHFYSVPESRNRGIGESVLHFLELGT